MHSINVTKSSLPPFEEYCAEIRDIWDSAWLTNMGRKHQALEAALSDYLGARHLSLFSNGHLALEAMLRVMDLQGEVITSPFTFASTAHAIVRCGLKPVYCDIKYSDYTIDEDKVEALINERTCAILPIHVYGNVCNHEKLAAVAQKHHIKLLYDAAHSFGEHYQGISTANMGDACIFSFHATKVFHTIEGGAVCFADPALREKLYLEKNFGIPNAEEVIAVGGNAKMNEFQAAMGLCNLRHVDSYIQQRRALCERYAAHLQGLPLRLCPVQEGLRSNYSYLPVLFAEGQRDKVFAVLKAENIHARKYFYPLCNAFACYEDSSDSTPIAKDVSRRILTLPLYPDLLPEDVDRICGILKEVLHA